MGIALTRFRTSASPRRRTLARRGLAAIPGWAEVETWLPSAKDRPSCGHLLYFEFRARGEPPHMVAAYQGLHLQNARLPFSQFGWMKRTLPGGVCPALRLPDGRLLGETQDISRHLARLASPARRPPLLTDGVQDEVFRLSNEPPISHSRSNPLNIHWLLNMFPAEQGLAHLPAYLDAVRPTFQHLERMLERNDGGGPFFSPPGRQPGYGDIGLFAVVDNIKAMRPDFLQRFGFERLVAWDQARRVTAASPPRHGSVRRGASGRTPSRLAAVVRPTTRSHGRMPARHHRVPVPLCRLPSPPWPPWPLAVQACAKLDGLAEYMAARPQLGTSSLGNPGSFMADGAPR